MILLGIILFIIAFILSIFGKGGGEFFVPIFLTAGISFHEAATTSLFILMVSGLSMMIIYHKKALIDWTTGIAVIIASASGAFAGGFVSAGIKPVYLKILFTILLLISSYFLSKPEKAPSEKFMKGPIWKRKCCGEKYGFPVLIVLPTIFIIGFIAGMVGISGGGLIVPLLIILGGMPLRIAFATNSIMVLFSSASGFIGRGLSMGVNWKLSLTIAAFVAAGALLGSHYSTRFNVKHLKKVFVWVLIIAAIWMILKIYI
jgi:uncharacterized membrane protein YfcA